MTDFSDLVVARSQVVIRTAVFAEMDGAEVSVSGLQSTSILRASGEIISALEASGETARVQVGQAGFISGAEKISVTGWLDLHGQDFFQLPRDEARSTVGEFRVAASATAIGTTIGTGKLVVRSPSGVLFESIEPFTPVLGGAVLVQVRAQVAGTSGNLGNNASLSLVTAYPGLTVTNPPLAGASSWITSRGRNTEGQKPYGDRMRARWADLAPQTPAERALSLVRATFKALGQTSPITRVWPDDTNPLGPGSWAIHMARDSSPATVEDVAAVDAYVGPRWAAGAGRFKSYAASTLTLAIAGTIKGPANSAAALVQASAALLALEVTFPLGGAKVYAESVRSALYTGVSGAANVTLTLPEETTIPPGSIVAFTVGALEVVP